MTDAAPLWASYNGGEVSPRMTGRTDTVIWPIALERGENFFVTVEGPAVKRPGFRFIRPAAATAVWLSTFIYSTTQAYVVEWSDEALRFYTNGIRIESGPTTPYEVAVPYSAAEAPEVWQQQSFDRLYLSHGNHDFAALRRTGAATFAHEVLELKNGPFADTNVDETITITASGTTGSITLTASSAIFVAGHVGALFRIEARDFSDIPAWEVGIDGVVIGHKRRSDGKVYVAATAGRTGSVQPIHTEGTEWDGSSVGQDVNAKGPYGVKWTYLHDRFGIGRITAIGGGGTTATVTVLRRLPDSLTTVASHRWAHALFSAAAGWPKHCAIWKGRMYLFRDFDIAASVQGDFLNHQQFTSSGMIAADLAFRHRLAAADPIIGVRADRQLLLFTRSAEYAGGPVNPTAPVAGDNFDAVPQSFYGSRAVTPAQIASSTLFVQRGGRKIREADYEFARDRYLAAHINRWARHILKSGVKQLAWQAEPEELLYAVRNDGVVAVHPHAPEQEIKGWTRMTLAQGGKANTAVAIPSDDGDVDELWVLVERDGALSVEQQAPFWEEDLELSDDERVARLKDAFFVDSGATWDKDVDGDGQPTTTLSGLNHLAGRDVMVLADGAVVANCSVNDDGELVPDLPFAAGRITVGLGYEARIKRLRPELRSRDGGTVQGKRKRVSAIVLRLLETAGLFIDPGTGKRDALIDRSPNDRMDNPIPTFNGDTDTKSVGGNWGRDGQYELISFDPLPCILVGEMPEYSLGER